ncbi:hypothetical protein FQA39_LY13959 [Lamprigera yunnana]|nr:hypothetical protein FQA39_LY13959 [Lamprigera yunnana]
MEFDSIERKFGIILSQGWHYRGEGNANLVLSLPKHHKILRIKKCDKPKTILEWFLYWILEILKWDIRDQVLQEKRDIDFYNLVMIPLLGPCYIHYATSINTDKTEIKKLDVELSVFRPEERKHKSLKFGMASLFMDYAFLPEELELYTTKGPTYAVEIKPKRGCVLETDRNVENCEFCANQYLKVRLTIKQLIELTKLFQLRNNRIKKLSSYCPLDLFSGNKDRMVKAIKSLILDPQNNFRVFYDGDYCYGENTCVDNFYSLCSQMFENNSNDLMDDFCELIIQALLKQFSSNDCISCDENSKILFEKDDLPSGCILKRILALQKLNRLGVLQYYNIMKALKKDNFVLDDWNYVEQFLDTIHTRAELCPRCVIMEISNRLNNVSPREYSSLDLVPYLIAAVANDLSFMVTFKKLQESDDMIKYRTIRINNIEFIVNIGVFDLYPKPIRTIEKHVKRRLKIEAAYLIKSSK